jgi:hypothetical protein
MPINLERSFFCSSSTASNERIPHRTRYWLLSSISFKRIYLF